MPKIIQINTALNCGSHGRIVEQISRVAADRGFDTTIVHGARYLNKSQFADIQTTTKNQERLNGATPRACPGRSGFHTQNAFVSVG